MIIRPYSMPVGCSGRRSAINAKYPPSSIHEGSAGFLLFGLDDGTYEDVVAVNANGEFP